MHQMRQALGNVGAPEVSAGFGPVILMHLQACFRPMSLAMPRYAVRDAIDDKAERVRLLIAAFIFDGVEAMSAIHYRGEARVRGPDESAIVFNLVWDYTSSET